MKERKYVDFSDPYPVFPKEKRGEYLVLVPDMLPWHFGILTHIMEKEGYRFEILKNEGRAVIDEGLKHVHNDACFPALCVIGQYLDALKSGKYDVDRTAVLITQTGGGCRASNYISLIRKALKSEFPQVPVLSLNFSGLEKESSLGMGFGLLKKLGYGILYADLIMTCYNRTAPYEREEGAAEEARRACTEEVERAFDGKGYKRFKKLVSAILARFAAIPQTREKKIKVGIVGEIYVKYSPLGNSHLEEFLRAEGCEAELPALADFLLYCIVNVMNDAKFYGMGRGRAILFGIVYRWFYGLQKNINKQIKKQGVFAPMHDFEHLRSLADEVINQGVKMGEGWLIPAEMAALAESGTENIVCAQPFGCLPNHIAGKGAVRVVKQKFPRANIVPVDYDPSATKVNQENRIKLMLAAARGNG